MLLILILSSNQIAKVRKFLHYYSDMSDLLRDFRVPCFRSIPLGDTTQNWGPADIKGLSKVS